METILNAFKAPFSAEAAKTATHGQVAAAYGVGAALLAVIIRG